MEKVIFQTNTPVELALRFTEGKPTESKFSTGLQYMYSTTDGRVFFVAEAAGRAIDEQLAKLGTQAGEFITIAKAEVDAGRGKKQIRWIVQPVGDAAEPPALKREAAAAVPPPARKAPVSIAAPEPMGERPDGTYAVPALAPAPAPIPVAVAAPQVPPASAPEWAQVLLAQTNVMVDTYAAAVKHAARYDGLIKPETVQSILVTAFINLSKNSTTLGGGR